MLLRSPFNLPLLAFLTIATASMLLFPYRALHLNPNSIDAHLNLGIAYAYGGLLARAVGEWKKVVYFKADHADAHRFLGRVYERMGKLEVARDNYREVLRLDPDNAEVKEALARLGQ